jgi:hypothetical protein
MRAEAIAGAEDALGKVPDGRPQYRVTVTKIQDAPVDTGPGDVKLAAAHALWAALGFVPSEIPEIGKDGPVFPT